MMKNKKKIAIKKSKFCFPHTHGSYTYRCKIKEYFFLDTFQIEFLLNGLLNMKCFTYYLKMLSSSGLTIKLGFN